MTTETTETFNTVAADYTATQQAATGAAIFDLHQAVLDRGCWRYFPSQEVLNRVEVMQRQETNPGGVEFSGMVLTGWASDCGFWTSNGPLYFSQPGGPDYRFVLTKEVVTNEDVTEFIFIDRAANVALRLYND